MNRVYKPPIGRVTIITQTLDRMRLIQNKTDRFSDALLASHKIIRTKNAKIYMLLLFERLMTRGDVAFKFSASGSQ